MYKCATQRMYNQGTKAGNTIINIMLSETTSKQSMLNLSLPFRGTGGCAYPCNAAAPLTISVSSVVIAACLARL